MTLEFYMDITTIGTYVSNSRIEGWPFTPNAGLNQNAGQLRLGNITSTTVNANSTSLYLGFYNNAATTFLYSQEGGTYNGNVWSTGVIAGSGSFMTNS